MQNRLEYVGIDLEAEDFDYTLSYVKKLEASIEKETKLQSDFDQFMQVLNI